MKTLVVATFLAGLLLAWPDALQSQQPTFKSAVDVVAVDVSVVDRSGRPVADLTERSFTLTVDGKPRRIASAQYISTARPVDQVPVAPTHASVNDGASGGRLIAIAIDQGNIAAGAGKLATDAAKRFIAGLNKADRIALYTIPGAGPRVDFTSSHATVQRLLDYVVGTAPRNVGPHNIGIAEVLALERNDLRTVENLIDRECPGFRSPEEVATCRSQLAGEARALGSEVRERTRDSLLGLRDLMERLALVPSPKTLVLISEGLLVDRELSQLTWVAPLAARAQLSLYVLQLEPPIFDASNARASATRMADIDIGQQGLAYLTGLARGDVFRVTAGADFAFQRISTELSGFYLLSFEPELQDRDGRSHKIRIQVPGRRDLLVRARNEFAVDAKRNRTSEQLLYDTLRSPLIATEIQLGVSTYNFWDPTTKKVRIVIASQIDRRADPSASVSVAYALIDSKGAIVADDFVPQLQTPVVSGTQSYIAAAIVGSDAYTLKLAVMDNAGKRGSVEHSFRAQLESAGQVRIGGPLLAERATAGSPLRPTILGEFSTDTVHAYLEVYSESEEQLNNTTVTIEVAHSNQGLAVDSAPLQFQPPDTSGTRVGEAAVTIALLPPGDYVARAIINVFGRKVGQLLRPFRIVAPAPK
jgi:VWFA-related protein